MNAPEMPAINDALSDQALINLYGRLLIAYAHLPDQQKVSAVNAGLNISTARLKALIPKMPGANVNDHLSNEELLQGVRSYFKNIGISGDLTTDQLLMVPMALRISPNRFKELLEYWPRG